VGLTTLVAVMLYLDRFCLAIMERDIKEDLDLSNRQVGWLLSAFSWTYAVAQVPSGWLSDRYGARRVLTLYIVLWSLFTGGMGAASSFLVLLTFRFGCGLAQAGAYPTSAGILSKWVPFRQRGLASGIVSTGGRVGGFIAPVLTVYLIVLFVFLHSPYGLGREQLHKLYLRSWRPVLLVYGGVGLLIAAWFWRVVRDRPGEHPSCNDAERALIEKDRPPSTGSPHGVVVGLPLEAILRSRSLWLSSLAQFATNFGWIFLSTWLPRYLTEVHEVPLLERGWMTSVPILVGTAGMLAGGWVTDVLTRALGLRWGRGLPMALTRFLALAAFLACLGLRSPWEVTVALSVAALATDLGTPATWAFMQDVGGPHVGSILGWGNMWGNLGAALSPLALNAIVEATGRWDLCFVACAAAFLVAGVASLGVDARIPILPPKSAEMPATGAAIDANG
jgi:sugar phosphate permease